VARFIVVRNAQPIARDPAWHARHICLLPVKGINQMKAIRLGERKVAKSWKWFQRPRAAHNPMPVLNMSIFNAGKSWQRIFNPIPQRENVWS